jgi:hypothetical protein
VLLNQKIYILESSSPSSSSSQSSKIATSLCSAANEKLEVATTTATCSSSLGNHIQLLHGNDSDGGVFPPTIVGWCIFGSVKVYDNPEGFLLDEQYHKVPASSPFGWTTDNTTPGVLYGWMIEQVGFDQSDIPQTVKTATLQRRMRSLFQIL